MISDWFKTVKDPDKKLELEQAIRASTTIVEQIRRIISEKQAEIYRSELKLESYDDAGYPFRQAFFNGQKKQLQYFLDLLTFDRETKPK